MFGFLPRASQNRFMSARSKKSTTLTISCVKIGKINSGILTSAHLDIVYIWNLLQQEAITHLGVRGNSYTSCHSQMPFSTISQFKCETLSTWVRRSGRSISVSLPYIYFSTAYRWAITTNLETSFYGFFFLAWCATTRREVANNVHGSIYFNSYI